MKRIWKYGILMLLILCCLVFTAVYWILSIGYGIDIYDRSGWSSFDGTKTQYLDFYGRPLTQWQKIDGNVYYFGTDGNMVRGWLKENGEDYYFSEDGSQYFGWLTLDGNRYYCTAEGILRSGWKEVQNNCYYFNDLGVLQTGWITENGDYYLTDHEGVRLRGKQTTDLGTVWLDEQGRCRFGWIHEQEGSYYSDLDSGVISVGWKWIENSKYYFDNEGLLQRGWLTVDGKMYYFHDDGKMAVGWTEVGENRYYFSEDGTIYRGWLETDDGRYYLKENGVMAIGQITLDGVNHFFSSQGKYVLLVNGWNPVPEDYTVNLVDFGTHQIDASCLEPFIQMLEDCKKTGHTYGLNNIYRSYDVQKYVWTKSIYGYMEKGYDYVTARYLTSRNTAQPGYSEHQTGLAVDILGSPAMYEWFREHAWEYGFIVRYPENKYEITGVIYEPWHLRYVGTELSAELQELDLCLEEYMQMLTEEQERKEARNN